MLVTSCLLQLLVSFFMEGKCSAACAAWSAEACHQLSNLSCVFCGSKPSSEATPYDIKYHLLSSGRPVTARKTREKFREKERMKREKSCVLVWLRAEDLVSKSLESPKFFNLGFYRLCLLINIELVRCLLRAIGSILRTSDRQSRNIDRVIFGHLDRGCHKGGIRAWLYDARMGLVSNKHQDKLEWMERTYRGYYHHDQVCYPHGGVHYLPARNLGSNTQSRIFTWPLFRELQEGFGSKLFGDERYELLVESQELLQRVEFELYRSQEFKK
ncbi:hypothetical protein IGI04_040145 [Brassica rapa subsp. trilocularis]|uniref:Uncharacterized protein n=1 Tax=Brassica rapa subsp. trilocularis TaxID=1813537 RepID=A0ABQ7KM04_BRACM|nr:hypothetical protein IGI04_040145 [Brassica rapa subsp. trilocularis]